MREIELKLFNVCRVDDDHPAVQWSARCKFLQTGNVADEITLAVEHNHALLACRHDLKIVGNQILERLGFAVPAPSDNMMRFKTHRLRDGIGDGLIEDSRKGCSRQIGLHQSDWVFLVGL